MQVSINFILYKNYNNNLYLFCRPILSLKNVSFCSTFPFHFYVEKDNILNKYYYVNYQYNNDQ